MTSESSTTGSRVRTKFVTIIAFSGRLGEEMSRITAFLKSARGETRGAYWQFRHRTVTALGETSIIAALVALITVPIYFFDHWSTTKAQNLIAHFGVPVAYGVISILIVVFIFQRNFHGQRFAQELLDRLRYPAFPDGGYYTARVLLKPTKRRFWFDTQLWLLPRSVPEIMIVASQIQHESRKYDIDGIKDQFSALEKRLETRGQSPWRLLNWVCFTTRNGQFVAYQPFNVFDHEVVGKGVNTMIGILNTFDEKKFSEEIEKRRGNEFASHFPFDALRETWMQSCPDGTSNLGALRHLLAEGDDHMMLVSSDGKPHGVLTLRNLVRNLFAGLLDGEAAPNFTAPSPADGGEQQPESAESEDEQSEDFTQSFAAAIDNEVRDALPRSDGPLDSEGAPDSGGSAYSESYVKVRRPSQSEGEKRI
jgi:hypothetical protein